MKVLEDCDLLKDQIPVNISRVAEGTQCIEWLDLQIGGDNMERKYNTDGKQLSDVTFENLPGAREAYKQLTQISVILSLWAPTRYDKTNILKTNK